jgi:hypothetical protein
MPSKTTTKAAPAKQTAAKAAAPAKATSTFDYSNLTVADAALPTITRQGKHRDNPFVAWLQESKDNNTGKTVTLPEAEVKGATYLIRRAATQLGVGSRVVEQDGPRAGTVTLLFAATKRKTVTRKAKDNAEATQ